MMFPQSTYSCPVERSDVTYPVYLIVDVISANSLQESYLREMGLVKLEAKSFPVGVCD